MVVEALKQLKTGQELITHTHQIKAYFDQRSKIKAYFDLVRQDLTGGL